MKIYIYIVVCLITLSTAVLYWLEPSEFGRVQTMFLKDGNSFSPQVVVAPKDIDYKTKTSFEIKFADYDHYEIGFLFDDNTFPSSFYKSSDRYEFLGDIKLLLKCNDEIIVDEDIYDIKSYFYQKGSLKYFKEAILWDFSLPRGTINILCYGEITFNKIDSQLLELKPSLFYALKGTP